MTLKQLQQKANAKLTQFWQVLSSRQDAYFAKHGKYFQLLISPTSRVVDGVDSDFTVRKPSDEKHGVDVDFAWSEKIPFQIRVDEWVRHDEAGYSATATIELPDGRQFKRTHHNNGDDTGWVEVLKDEI